MSIIKAKFTIVYQCFLTRGQCYISWERGAEVFDGKAIPPFVLYTLNIHYWYRIPH